MRNYQYTPEEEAEMDAFGNEWKKTNRGIKGPSAWREFKRKHPWAKRITADALRQKYTRMKRDQYWKAYALTHAKCPRGHATCYATSPYSSNNADSVMNGINSYVSSSTSTIAPSSPLPGSDASSKSSVASSPNGSTTGSIPSSASTSSGSIASVASASSTSGGDGLNKVASAPSPSKTAPSNSSTTTSPNTVKPSDESTGKEDKNVKPAESKPVAESKPIVESKPTVESKPAVESKPVVQSKPVATVNPSEANKAKEILGKVVNTIIDGCKKDDTSNSNSDAVALFGRIQQIIDGVLVPKLVDDQLVLTPLNGEAGAVKCVSMRDLMNQAKAVLLVFLDKKFEETAASSPSTLSADNVKEMLQKLKAHLEAELEKLIETVLSSAN